jgi:hypothetical protein
MPKKIKLADLKERAKAAIEREEPFVYDLADEHCQILDNVKHMNWFINEVCKRLCGEHKKYSHLLDELSE